jgi:hypothetical protein
VITSVDYYSKRKILVVKKAVTFPYFVASLPVDLFTVNLIYFAKAVSFLQKYSPKCVRHYTISEAFSTPHFLTYLFEITGPRNFELLQIYRSSGRKLIKTRPEQKRKVNLGVFTRYFHKSGYIQEATSVPKEGKKISQFHFYTAQKI